MKRFLSPLTLSYNNRKNRYRACKSMDLQVFCRLRHKNVVYDTFPHSGKNGAIIRAKERGIVMNILAVRTADFLLACGAIKQKDISIYRYGLEVLYLSVLEVMSILLLAVWVGNFFETLLYFAAFIPLRLFAGGYHANTRLGCYFVSLGVYGAFSVVVAFATISYLWLVLLAMIALVIIWRYAPIVHRNHKISQKDLFSAKSISQNLALVELLVVIVVGFFQYKFLL